MDPASINTQPVKDIETVSRPHLCACEHGCAKCINFCLCVPQELERQVDCPTKCSDLLDFRVYYCSSGDDGWCCGIVCFPISLVLKLFLQVPCVGYNICRNRCKGTKEMDYLP